MMRKSLVLAMAVLLLGGSAWAQTMQTMQVGQKMTVSGGGLDDETRHQIVKAVKEARRAAHKLKELKGVPAHQLKEKAELVAEQIDVKLEKILTLVERNAGPQMVQVEITAPTEPVLTRQPFDDPAPPPPAVMEPPPPPLMTPPEVERLVAAISGESFSDDQLRVLKLGMAGALIRVSDIKRLLAPFPFSEDKLKALTLMAPYLADAENAFQILEVFTFSDDKDAAQQILGR